MTSSLPKAFSASVNTDFANIPMILQSCISLALYTLGLITCARGPKDSRLVERPGRERRKWIRQAVSDWRSVLFYDLAFTLTKQEKMNSWAFRWYLSTWKAGGYSLCPASNLVRNVGIGVDSTHSRFEFHVANPAVGSFELPLTREPLAYDRSVSERFHLFYNRADSPWKLMRIDRKSVG